MFIITIIDYRCHSVLKLKYIEKKLTRVVHTTNCYGQLIIIIVVRNSTQK